MKDKQQAQVASLAPTRDTLVKLRTALKNKVNKILSARGINLEKEALSSGKALTAVLELRLDALVRVELKVVIDQIRSLNRSIAELEKTISQKASKPEGHQHRTSIQGIGPFTGAILLSVIGDIPDFANEGQRAAYFGVVPRIQNPNETARSSRIIKRGSKLGRTALGQYALIAQRYSPYLKQHCERIQARRGTGKAILALARMNPGPPYPSDPMVAHRGHPLRLPDGALRAALTEPGRDAGGFSGQQGNRRSLMATPILLRPAAQADSLE